MCFLSIFTLTSRNGTQSAPDLFRPSAYCSLIGETDIDIDALKIVKSLADFAANIRGIVPQFGGRSFDIILDSADTAARLAQSGFDYGDIRKPLKLLRARLIHVSIFVSVEFPDEDL